MMTNIDYFTLSSVELGTFAFQMKWHFIMVLSNSKGVSLNEYYMID